MALDGTVISCMAWELNHALAGGKINKIAQPEKDELMLTIKNNRKQYRLLVSASASLPLVYLTDQNKTGPMTAPNFCMLLRKHIGSGRILRIWQPGMERILNMEIEQASDYRADGQAQQYYFLPGGRHDPGLHQTCLRTGQLRA